ncbi:prepilin-type N-terminal cleavage/methylation domain-containing protein [Elusimicrobium simillimum]|uniref:type IV pilin protein n=1 Tax=Elusimicrobium simillimum TaxID=3143438 RepID=UPI003C6EEF26
MNKGFTLIELLVVVLIIGILAAIALPQYNKAVEKSRVSEAVVKLKAVGDAMERYLLQNQNITKDMSDLDIDIQDQYYTYSIGEDSDVDYFWYIRAVPPGGAYVLSYFIVTNQNTNYYKYNHRITCLPQNDIGKTKCKQIGKDQHKYGFNEDLEATYII